MRLAFYEPETGVIKSVLTFPNSNVSDAVLNVPEGMLAVEVGENVTPSSHYVDASDAPKEYPPRPVRWAKWDGGKWVDLRGEQEQLAEIRIRRNVLLAETDWTQLPDAPLTDEQRAAWREYRQALRDLPETGGDWPEQPTG